MFNREYTVVVGSRCHYKKCSNGNYNFSNQGNPRAASPYACQCSKDRQLNRCGSCDQSLSHLRGYWTDDSDSAEQKMSYHKVCCGSRIQGQFYQHVIERREIVNSITYFFCACFQEILVSIDVVSVC